MRCDLQIAQSTFISTCEYCGSTMTIPSLDTEKRRQLYDRANHFRRNNEYDKAMEIYNRILDEDKQDAEAYWSIVLCKYGIEYVEDKRTHKRVPTCNRTRHTSIYADEDFKAALIFGTETAKRLYQEDAAIIDGIQKAILEISSQEAPFDIFICYKESDTYGRRTHDSVLAQDMYNRLCEEGFRVFFARITLENKLGSAYEPYIFAALNSAKVMICLGTTPEYFNEVWVRNEWSRYLTLMKAGEKKTLIPAYCDMNPYDLPPEFSHLQALDMSKLGFMQDLLHGVKKIIGKSTEQEVILVENLQQLLSVNLQSLLKRAFFNLEYGDWEKAEELFEQILNQDHECSSAYIGKLLVGLKLHHQEDLKNHHQSLKEYSLYQKALLFADSEYTALLESFEAAIQNRELMKQEAENNKLYQRVQRLMGLEEITTIICQNIIVILVELGDFKDSKQLLIQYEKKLKRLEAEQSERQRQQQQWQIQQQELKQIRRTFPREKYDSSEQTVVVAVYCLFLAVVGLIIMITASVNGIFIMIIGGLLWILYKEGFLKD